MENQLNFEFTIEKSDITGIAADSFKCTGSRPYQEDNCGFSLQNKKKAFCAVLSDGMGGLSNGDKVSGYTVSSFIEQMSSIRGDIPSELVRIINEINSEIVSRQYGGGATALAVYCCQKGVYFCSTGDSRLYLFRKGILTQLTEDFDVMNRELVFVINGEKTYDEAYSNPERDNLVEFIGANKQLSPDANVKPFVPLKGDKLLMCSDGVYNSLSEEDIIYCLGADATAAVLGLESAINEKALPNQDNGSAIVIEFR